MRARSKLFATLLATSLIGLSAGAAMASGDGDCAYAPRADWRSTDDARAAVEAQGYKVVRVKTDDNCYEAYARDEKGAKVEIYIDPVSLKIVSMEHDD